MALTPVAPDSFVAQVQAAVGGQGAPAGGSAYGQQDELSFPVWVGPASTRPPANPRQADMYAGPEAQGMAPRVDSYVDRGRRAGSGPLGQFIQGQYSSSYSSVGPVHISTVGDQLKSFYSFTDEDIKKLRTLAERAGAETDYLSLRKFWEQSVLLASERYRNGMKQENPWQVAAMLAEDAAAGQAQMQTDQSVQVTDPESAAAAARSMFEERLGRRATAEEVSAFVEALRAYEESNPRITSSLQTPGDPEAGTGTGTSTVVTGGANPNAFADRWMSAGYGKEEDIRKVNVEYRGMLDSLLG